MSKILSTILVIGLLLPLTAFNQSNGPSFRKRSDFPQGQPFPRYGFTIMYGAEILHFDYKNYLPLVGHLNDTINEIDGMMQLGFGSYVRDNFLGITYCYGEHLFDRDSIEVDFRNTSWQFTYGYNILNTWRFRLRYDVSLKLSHVRLINTASEDKISINQYIQNRDLDIRINQPLSCMGFNLEYKFYGKELNTYWSFGVYGGYIFKLTPFPTVRSRSTRLTDVPPLGVSDYYGGFYLAFIGDWY